ncbi:MAG TPA: DUF6134 family protein [Stellaceae bacterium]|nr:DUF6134 family protein [Stellaceae bacterium]
MNRIAKVGCAVALLLLMACESASSAERSVVYVMKHPTYGNIGILVANIDQSGDVTRVAFHRHIAVKALGLVVYRQDAEGVEVFRGGRLISLESSADDNGKHLEVHGAARGEQFIISSPSGTRAAPAEVIPADPWFIRHTGEGTLVTPMTGKILNMRVSGGDEVNIAIQNIHVQARHFIVAATDRQQEVWLDQDDVPVMFRTVEDGNQVDFILKTPATDDATTRTANFPQ